jgi:hypothetical protein
VELSRKLGVLGTERSDLAIEISMGETTGFQWFRYLQCSDLMRGPLAKNRYLASFSKSLASRDPTQLCQECALCISHYSLCQIPL